jgi:hypothetical protein
MGIGRQRNRDRSGNFKHDRRNLRQFSRTECRIMVKAPALLLLSLALTGCAMAPQAHLASDASFKPARFAWDGAGEDPNRTQRVGEAPRAAHNAVRSDRLRDGLDIDRDALLSRSLVICNGCLRSQPSEDARFAKASD